MGWPRAHAQDMDREGVEVRTSSASRYLHIVRAYRPWLYGNRSSTFYNTLGGYLDYLSWAGTSRLGI